MTDAIDNMVKKYEIDRIGPELRDIKESMEHIHLKSDTALRTANEAKVEIENLKEEVHSLEKKLAEEKKWRLKIETEQRFRVLKIMGLRESMGGDKNCLDKVKEFIENSLELQNITVTKCFRVGKWRENQKGPRMIVVNFATDLDRNRVWEARKKLGKSGIYLKEDLPLEVQKNASLLAPLLMGARKRGLKANLHRDSLYINNERFRLDSLHKMKGDISPDKLTTYETDECVFFWSRYSPLSNFNQDFSFIYDNEKFTSVEQAFCYSRAAYCNDRSAMAKIKQLNDPVEMKRTQVEGFNKTEWEKVAEKKMKEILKCKLAQTPRFRDILKATEPKTLCEAVAYEKVWGIGMNILNKDIDDQTKWGRNLLGRILQGLRDAI
jgi:ribA/ribD-fused uncharacterized protein